VITTDHFEFLAARNATEFEAGAKLGAYQIVTGEGALDILSEMESAALRKCFKNCTYAHSFGDDSKLMEDFLDEISDPTAEDGEGFFPTISDTSSAKLIWTIIPNTFDAPRLIALSKKPDFVTDIASWFAAAELELVSEELHP
jgi:hypothetical protein